MTNLKDILSTVAAIIVFLIGTYTQYTDSLPAGASFNWKAYLVYLAIAVGLYLQGKNANGTTKTAAQVTAQADPGKPAVQAAFPMKVVAKVLVIVLLLPALVGVSGCAGTTAPIIIGEVCTIGNEICGVEGTICAIQQSLTPRAGVKITGADSAAFQARQKFWTDSLYVLAGELQKATKR